MRDANREILERFGGGEHTPLPKRARGTLRLELVEGKRTDRWLVAIDNGAVEVTHGNGAADCVIRTDRELFVRMVAGKVNAFAAVLRGDVAVGGDPRLLVLFQRLLPGPSRAR